MIALIYLNKDVAMHVQRRAMNHTILQLCLLHLQHAIVVLSRLVNFLMIWKDFAQKSSVPLIVSKNCIEVVFIINVILVGDTIQTMVAVLIAQIIITEGIILTKHQVLVLYAIVADMGTEIQCVLYSLLVVSLFNKTGTIVLIASLILNLVAAMLAL